jgi:hypothetical protein
VDVACRECWLAEDELLDPALLAQGACQRYDQDMEPLSPEELSQYATQFSMEAKIVQVGRGIADTIRSGLNSRHRPSDNSDRWMVLEALAHDVMRNLSQYSVGADLPLLAWTTRNIFELDTILIYVSASAENLASFLDDVILDEIQVRSAAIGLNLDRADPTVTRRQDETIDRLRKRKAEIGITRDRPLRTIDMARKISPEWEREYQALNKLYSKIVHPTAYLLMGGRLEPTDWEAYRLRMMVQGVERAREFCLKWRQELQ